MDEQKRLEVLHHYQLLDTLPESQFDEITQLAALICGTPIAIITLVDKERQWFLSRIGITATETARSLSFCAHAIQDDALFMVPDTQLAPEFRDNPLVSGPPHLRFYAGAPLITEDGCALGTLAVMDTVPRALSAQQQDALTTLSRDVVARFRSRLQLLDLCRQIDMQHDASGELLGAYRRLCRRTGPAVIGRSANDAAAADITETAKEADLSQLFINSIPGIFYVFDQRGKFLRWNKNFELVTGRSITEIAEAGAMDIFGTAGEKHAVAAHIKQALADGSATLEVNVLTSQGEPLPYYLTGRRIEFAGEYCICGMGADISERRASEEILRLRNRALEASINAIMITDAAGMIEYVNPAFERITGYPLSQVSRRHFRFLHRNDNEQRGMAAVRSAYRLKEEGHALLRSYRRNGDLFWNDFYIAPVANAENVVTHFIGVLNDITEIKRYEERLEHEANYDALTQLVNRNVLKDRISQAIASSRRHNTEFTVGFMDLDNFKFINDSLGHGIGDELLKSASRRLATCMRAQDTIARYGGDEFAFVLIDTASEENVAILMDRILKTIERPFEIGEHRLFISCSVGVGFYPKDGDDADTLLKNADTAMYRAKESGRNNYQFYTPSMNERVRERLSLEAKLRQALNNEEFALHYQPKIDLASGMVVGIEALLRWNPTDGDAVSPASFIPLAEETGLIVPIGEWVLDTACAHNKQMQEFGLPPIGVAVNISARQFDANTLRKSIVRALDTSGLDARYLELELTESLVMQNPDEVTRILLELREMGLRLAIDDFGTGYSSLSQLQRFPLDRLKIDQSFVRDIGADPNDAIIARAVISLGHSLGMSVIAEGVSNEEQLAFLRANGCDEMQGYLYSRPLPFKELMGLLSEKRPLM
jgi:diguanylate cyclase (GGDEF)-like protein/PAS domain S-box-containing protein